MRVILSHYKLFFICLFFFLPITSYGATLYTENFDDAIFQNCNTLASTTGITSGSAQSGTYKLEEGVVSSTLYCESDLFTGTATQYIYYLDEVNSSASQLDWLDSDGSPVFGTSHQGFGTIISICQNAGSSVGCENNGSSGDNGGWNKIAVTLTDTIISLSIDDSFIASTTRTNSSTPTRIKWGESAHRLNLDSITVSGSTEFDSEIPPNTQDYIVITSPNTNDDGVANTSYNTSLSGQLNIVNPTSTTTSYIISFASELGLYDYSNLQINATTTNQDEFVFNHNVTFSNDDVVLVRAYLYDNENYNAVGIKDISPEYTWWVSVNGNPTETINLGVFRGTSTDPCYEYTATSTWTVAGFQYALCTVGRSVSTFLLVPNQDSIDFFTSQFAVATATPPFSYAFGIQSSMDSLYSTTTASSTWDITMPSSTPVFGNLTLLDSSDIDGNSNYQIVRNAMVVFMYLGLIMYIYHRNRIFIRSL